MWLQEATAHLACVRSPLKSRSLRLKHGMVPPKQKLQEGGGGGEGPCVFQEVAFIYSSKVKYALKV